MGSKVGLPEGIWVGDTVGFIVFAVGIIVGSTVGLCVGLLGAAVGS